MDGDFNNFLSVADLVLYGSFLEEQSFPPILVQAMSLGKPVIAPDLDMTRKHVSFLVFLFIIFVSWEVICRKLTSASNKLRLLTG